MKTLYGFVVVFLGSGLGGALRHAVNLGSQRLLGPDVRASTFAVNLLGSLTVGALAGHLALRGHAAPAVQLFLTTGILGGFTTFSAFSLEAALLWERGNLVSCAAFVLASVLLSVAAVFAGLALVRAGHAG